MKSSWQLAVGSWQLGAGFCGEPGGRWVRALAPVPTANCQLPTANCFSPCHPPLERLREIRLLAMDVDGVLTDGSLVWTLLPGEETPSETKVFDVKDGLAISLARGTPLEIAWLTGRRTGVVERRARELGVTELHQGARDKKAVLEVVRNRLGRDRAEVAYLGDDLNDLPAYEAAGLRVAVADAAPELIAVADWVTQRPGGRGAVREVVEILLRAQDCWEAAVAAYLARLREEQGPGVGQ